MSRTHCVQPLFRSVVKLVLVGCCLRCCAGAATPAPDTQVRLTPVQGTQFLAGFKSLSEQAHVAVVTEGVPLKPLLDIKAAPDLTTGAAIGPAVTALAAAYDYDAQRVGNVFVLTKRYSNPQDLPCVTFGECREAAETITSLLDAFNPHLAKSVYANGPDGEKAAIVKFFAGLSTSQMAAAQSKTLRYGALSPDQQKIVDNLFLFMLIQLRADRMAMESDNLSIAEKGALTLSDPQGYSGLFLALPGSAPVAEPSYLSLLGGVTQPGQPNPLLAQLPLPEPGDRAALPPSTLGTVVAALGPIDGQKPTAVLSISGKPVTAFGLGYAPPINVMRALAALYGLRNGASASGSLQIEPMGVIPPSSLRQLNSALWAAMPVSFDRALHLQSDSRGVTYLIPTVNSDGSPVGPAALTEAYIAAQTMQAEADSRMLPGEMRQEAGRRLLVAMEAQVKKSGGNARVLVSSLDDSTRSALAVLLMTDIVSELQVKFSSTKSQVMDCLDNMDQTIIYTVPNAAAHVHGQVVPTFNLVGTDPYTNKQINLGGIQYASHD